MVEVRTTVVKTLEELAEVLRVVVELLSETVLLLVGSAAWKIPLAEVVSDLVGTTVLAKVEVFFWAEVVVASEVVVATEVVVTAEVVAAAEVVVAVEVVVGVSVVVGLVMVIVWEPSMMVTV